MGLFSLQEICNKCEKAIWHECCKNFCHCKDGHEQTVNGYNGTCEYKVVLPQADVIKSVCPRCSSSEDIRVKPITNDCMECGHTWQTVL